MATEKGCAHLTVIDHVWVSNNSVRTGEYTHTHSMDTELGDGVHACTHTHIYRSQTVARVRIHTHVIELVNDSIQRIVEYRNTVETK